MPDRANEERTTGTDTDAAEGYELRPVARFIAGVTGLADLALLTVLVLGFLLPVARVFPSVPLDLAVRTVVFLLVAVLAQVLLVPLSVQLYRFPE